MTRSNVPLENPRPGRQADMWSLLRELTGFAEPENQVRGFPLQLKDGSRWWIASARQASGFTEELVTIMQLQEGDPEDSYLMFFYEDNADHRPLEIPLLKAQGWRNRNNFFFQTCFHPLWHHVLCECDFTKPGCSPYVLMCEALAFIHQESIRRGGLPFHAAFLEYQGQGVILAAAGDTGKSTCSHRVSPPWRALCDDEVLVVSTPEGRYLAHPFPTWTDYLCERGPNTWKVEESYPLAGIFFIEQAPEDDCLPLDAAAAAVSAITSAGQIMSRFLRWCDAGEARELRETMFANACEIVKQIPAFRLRVCLGGRFWEKIEAALGWR